MGWFGLFISLNFFAFTWMAQTSGWQFTKNQRPPRPPRAGGSFENQDRLTQTNLKFPQNNQWQVINPQPLGSNRAASDLVCANKVQNNGSLRKETGKDSSESVPVSKITVSDTLLGTKTFLENEAEWNLSHSQQVVVLIPNYGEFVNAFQEEYIKLYCNTLKDSFIKIGNYTVICYEWEGRNDDESLIIDLAQIKGINLSAYLQKAFSDTAKIHLVAHGFGCIVAQFAGLNTFDTYDFIFGLDQKFLKGPNMTDFYLTKDAAKMVETIYSEYTSLPQVNRNFYFVPNDDDSGSISVYETFAKVVSVNGTMFSGVLCSSETDFNKGKCDSNKKVPMWRSDFMTDPSQKFDEGTFFIRY